MGCDLCARAYRTTTIRQLTETSFDEPLTELESKGEDTLAESDYIIAQQIMARLKTLKRRETLLREHIEFLSRNESFVGRGQ